MYLLKKNLGARIRGFKRERSEKKGDNLAGENNSCLRMFSWYPMLTARWLVISENTGIIDNMENFQSFMLLNFIEDKNVLILYIG